MSSPEKNIFELSRNYCFPSFICFFLFLLYEYLVQATKPSPLQGLPVSDNLILVFQLLFYSAMLAVIFTAVAILFSLLSLRMWRVLPRIAIVIFLALFMSIVIENFIYTIFDVGMKSTNYLILKIFVAYAAVRLALDIYGFIFKVKWVSSWKLMSITYIMAAIGCSYVLYFHYLSDPELYTSALSKEGSHVNIVILSSDGIDAASMGVYGYERDTTPFLSNKVDEFAVYNNAFANNTKTTGSIVSFLTGVLPLANGVIFPPDILDGVSSRRSFPEILGELGYRRTNWAIPYYASAQEQNMVGAFDVDNGSRIFPLISMLLPDSFEYSRWLSSSAITELKSVALGVFAFQDFDNPFDAVSKGDVFKLDEYNINGVLEEINNPSPFFINSHFLMTHGGLFPVKEPFFSKGQQQSSEWMTDFYDDSIRDFDALVRQVYQHLKQSGQLDKTILIVTSDHGSKWSNLNRIPLMVRFPNQEMSGRYASNVQRLDVAPTLLSYLGVPQPAWMTGNSLLSNQLLDPERVIFSYGVLQNINAASIGRASDFKNHSVTLIQCDSAYTIDSPSLQGMDREHPLAFLRGRVQVSQLNSSTDCPKGSGISLDSALSLLLNDLSRHLVLESGSSSSMLNIN